MHNANLEASIACRDFLTRAVELELVGPKRVDEVLNESPQQRYIVGQLAPVDVQQAGDAFDEELTLDESDVISGQTESTEAVESESDSSFSKARSQSLSSLGVSFVVERSSEIDINANWGEYSALTTEAEPAFARRQAEASLRIRFDEPSDLRSHSFGRVELQWVARLSGKHLIASVFLVNATKNAPGDGTERIYQVALTLSGVDGGRPFLSRERVIREGHRTSDDLLYRNRREYGVGLHTAVEEEDVDPIAGAAGILRTAIAPRVETYVTTPVDVGNPKVLSMRYLAMATSRSELARELRSTFSGYWRWPLDLADRAAALDDALQGLARDQLDAINARIARLEEGISALEMDERALEAFRFANEAMARTRFRQEHLRDGLGIPSHEAMSGVWRPFQLAFILSQIPETMDASNPNRDLVDVLFFPTGGGKTEAYLGLAAFTIAWRRFDKTSSYAGAGTSVLMRYTLRLLTAQQFSRAATLMAAAELMRSEGWNAGALGPVPFSIGLWVGPMTPTRYEDAAERLKEARIAHDNCARDCELSRATKEIAARRAVEDSDAKFMVLTECPWCNEPLCVGCVRLQRSPNRIELTCGNDACPFSASGAVGRIPVWFVDSDVYRECPTMLIGTVDKFAMLPYRGEAKAIFGNVRGYCEACGFYNEVIEHPRTCKAAKQESGPMAAFNLVIQDELHTITDNVGSAYGMYETVIEFLSRLTGPKPKYIGATATVKDVERQIRQLYGGRPAAVFPPTGLDAGDTFFSRDVPPSTETPGRTFVGIYAPTKSRLTTFVAVLSSVLAAAWECRQRFPEAVSDPFLTMLAYFNTIRDLGAVKSLLADDVPPLMHRVAIENGWSPRDLSAWEDELTGRIDSGEVPRRLALLSQSFGEAASGGGCDFMACTNMVSVGVDVPRLGLMVVDGQPKSAAEYIQATSRIGRSSPGIVFVVYNAMRPRDVSHYEHFFSYHLSYYRFVEGGSVTPFSDGCIDRYLQGAYVAGYRLADHESANNAAGRFKTDPTGNSARLAAFMSQRAALFGEHERESATAATDAVITEWSTCDQELQYARRHAPPGVRVAKKFAGPRPVIAPPEDRAEERALPEGEAALFVAPRSMRSVEASVPLKVARG